MAKDVESVPAGTATVAARLCNFATSHSNLLQTHKEWLNTNVIPAIRNSPNPWVDVFGYASHLGNPRFNKHLSDLRCKAIVDHIKSSVPTVSFPQDFGFGDSRSTGGATNNDGYWRAAELYVYAAGKPPVPKHRPTPIVLPVVDDWFVTDFGGHSESAVVVLGYSAMSGHITFARADGTNYKGEIGMVGLTAGLSLDPGKIPGVSKLLSRFPALNQLLGGGAELGGDLIKWIMRPGALQSVINKTPGGMNMYKGMLDVILGGSVAPDSPWAPSTAIGLVLPFKPLSTLSFYGGCMCFAVTGTVAIASGGVYLLYFGYRGGSMLSTSFSLDNFTGCAVISAVGAQVQVPGLGAGGTLFFGEIT